MNHKWNPALAALLSILIPGLGHFYKRKILAGVVWFTVTLIGYVMLIVPGLILHAICIVMSAMGDTTK